MPELPEVETILSGITPHILNAIIDQVIVRQKKLRWPIPTNLSAKILKQQIISTKRRGKYILLTTTNGTLIIHLGMSGSLQIVNKDKPLKKHDHLDIIFSNKQILRYNDPRRFGAILFTDNAPEEHKLLKNLGIEPLTNSFNGDYLFKESRNKKTAIKSFIMNSNIIVGIGNIYANEALFFAGINPEAPANKITHTQYQALAKQIKKVLQASIKNEGTTLKDYITSNGKKGNFQNKLSVYARTNEPCIKCKTRIKQFRQNGRSSYYCPKCQMEVGN